MMREWDEFRKLKKKKKLCNLILVIYEQGVHYCFALVGLLWGWGFRI